MCLMYPYESLQDEFPIGLHLPAALRPEEKTC